MTFPVTNSISITERNFAHVTVCSYLKNFYKNQNSAKKITQEDQLQFNQFLKETRWNDHFSYSLYDLKQALTHSSFSHEWGSEYPSNERVEFVGDGVLNLVVAEMLYQKYPDFKEGKLSKLRGALVNEDELAVIAKVLNLSDSLFLGKGEIKKGELQKSTLADTVEALIGVIYLSEGFDAAKSFITEIFNLYENKLGVKFLEEKRLIDFDPKSILQEKLQQKFDKTPDYRSMEISQGNFRVELWIGDDLCLVKSGNNKKVIEKELAKEYLQKNNF